MVYQHIPFNVQVYISDFHEPVITNLVFRGVLNIIEKVKFQLIPV